MKFKNVIISAIAFAGIANAATAPSYKSNTPAHDQVDSPFPGAVYSYTDINFNSTVGSNFNRFNGHSNLYGFTGENFKLTKKLNFGFALFKIDTNLNSQVNLSPTPFSISKQKIENHTIFAHLLKQLNSNILGDISGGYGQNKISSVTNIDPLSISPETGVSNFSGDNWFGALTGIYIKPIKKFTINANIRALYSHVSNEESGLYLLNAQATQPILSSTNDVLFFIENLLLEYKLNNHISPFINAGLIQVAHYSSTTPTTTAVINGSLPQLAMNKNGYKFGGGLALRFKNSLVRVDQQYYNSGNTFINNQTIVSYRYLFDK